MHPCPSCKQEAPRLFDKTAFGFGFAAGGTAPANSGVHDQDYPSADKIVGRNADTRWASYRERDKVKRQVREIGGSPALERIDGEGYTEYTAMGQSKREARAKLVDLAVAVERQQTVKPGN